jgi:ABC-type phosphate/phosphonate transport system permease subunit
MSGRKEDKERLTEPSKQSNKRYETTKMGVVLFVTCVAAIVSHYKRNISANLRFCNYLRIFFDFLNFLKYSVSYSNQTTANIFIKIVSIIGVAIIGGALGWIRNLIGIIACVAGAIGSWGCFPLTLLFVVSL